MAESRSLDGQSRPHPRSRSGVLGGRAVLGLFWLVVALAGAGLAFRDGLEALWTAWQLPEYSHGPVIPILSGLLFLRQLKDVPEQPGPLPGRWPGLIVMALALGLALAGHLIRIPDFVAYALILWIGALLLVSFGWQTGRDFWPPVLHLVFMLPLPGMVYYGLSTYLQGVSSQLGVQFLQLMAVPVYLDGNIIDLGVMKLHVAEACSGLRYLFPIMSFSYVFAVLYKGPVWHKAVLLLSAAPITVLMNSVRIAIAGWIVNIWGVSHVEGFSHFFEGWVIFVCCIAILFGLARLMLLLQPGRPSLADALDLDVSGLGPQMARLRLVWPSAALIVFALSTLGLGLAWTAMPPREPARVDRIPFALFPKELGQWEAGPRQMLDPNIARVLKADDYHSVLLSAPQMAVPVDLFLAWYDDQSRGGVHSPEVCLPGAGWEISSVERVEAGEDAVAAAGGQGFVYNRAVIQNGTERMLVYYWFEQNGMRTSSELVAKLALLKARLANGREDSALIRLMTPITADPDAVAMITSDPDGMAAAERRLQDSLKETLRVLPDFVPTR